VWLVQNDFVPLTYADARAQLRRGLLDHIWRPLSFTASQLFFLIPAMIIALPLLQRWDRALRVAPVDARNLKIVTVLALGPAGTMIVIAALTGRGTVALWGYPLWNFLGLWLVMVAGVAFTARRLAAMAVAWSAVSAVMAVAFVIHYTIQPQIQGRYVAELYPGDAVARIITERYAAATGRPLNYVLGSIWTAGNIAHYSTGRPHVVVNGNPSRVPWLDVDDLRAKGGVVAWTSFDLHRMRPEFEDVIRAAEPQPPIAIPMRRGPLVLHLNWAILPAQRP
jgi:hypothetical protein